jgi:hypothetical protein
VRETLSRPTDLPTTQRDKPSPQPRLTNHRRVWEPARTCGNRNNPGPVRPKPTGKMVTLSTPRSANIDTHCRLLTATDGATDGEPDSIFVSP